MVRRLKRTRNVNPMGSPLSNLTRYHEKYEPMPFTGIRRAIILVGCHALECDHILVEYLIFTPNSQQFLLGEMVSNGISGLELQKSRTVHFAVTVIGLETENDGKREPISKPICEIFGDHIFIFRHN